MWDLLKELAGWIGWFPITIGAFIVMLLGKYFYDRKIEFKDLQLEDSKQYRVDLLVQNLSQRIKILNEELERKNNDVETGERKRSLIEQEKAEIQEKLDLAHSEALKLRERLEPIEKELDDLLGARAELDFCQVCTVDEEHVMMNTIYWGGKSGKLVGDTALVDEGVCLYCASVNLKCKVCGAITGIDASATDVIECEGCCETLYTPLSFFGKKSDITIRVSRLVSE